MTTSTLALYRANFEALNQIIAPLVLRLPEISVTTTQGIDITVTNLECRDISLDQLVLRTEGDAGFETALPPGTRMPPPPPPLPPLPQACTQPNACNSACGVTPTGYDEANLATATPSQCYFCDSYRISDAPAWCEFRFDGWTVDCNSHARAEPCLDVRRSPRTARHAIPDAPRVRSALPQTVASAIRAPARARPSRSRRRLQHRRRRSH